jgi:rubredoxin
MSMSTCPSCGNARVQFVVSMIAKAPTGECRQTDTYYCDGCEHEWQVEEGPPPSTLPYSGRDFEIIASQMT